MSAVTEILAAAVQSKYLHTATTRKEMLKETHRHEKNTWKHSFTCRDRRPVVCCECILDTLE
jgi:hypothetical protein